MEADPVPAFRAWLLDNVHADEATLADGSILDDHFSSMGGWISSTLVRLGDLNFEFLPPLEKDED